MIDGVNRAVGDHGMNPNDGNDISQFMRLVTTPFHERGVTVLMLDHPATNGRYAAGSYQKLAVIDGTYYAVEVARQPAPGAVGRLRLRIAKDRPGGVRARTPASNRAGDLTLAAVVVIDSTGDRPRTSVESPSEAEWKPTALMERVSRYLEMCPEPASKHSVKVAVSGKAEFVRRALDQLVDDEYVTRSVGVRNTLLHEIARPYREVQS